MYEIQKVRSKMDQRQNKQPQKGLQQNGPRQHVQHNHYHKHESTTWNNAFQVTSKTNRSYYSIILFLFICQ